MEPPEQQNDGDDRPGCGCFLTILAGITVMYIMHISLPGRHEAIAHWIARQPTWWGFVRTWTFIVVPIAGFFGLGFYLFRGRFLEALFLAIKIIGVLVILGYVAVIVATLLGLR
jgi:hypothetical protein